MAKLQERVDLRLPQEMYSILLEEADGDARRVPEVIRQRLSASLLGTDDVKQMKAQMQLLLTLVRELVLDNVPTVVRMKSILNDYEGDDLVRERAATEKAFVEKLERIDRMKREAGL